MMKYIIGIPLVIIACFLTEEIATKIADAWNSWLSTIAAILFAVAAVAGIAFLQYKFGIYNL